MKIFLKKYPLFLFLLPLFVVVHIEKDLHGLINYSLIYDHIVILFTAPLVFFVLFYLFSKSVRRSALRAFVVLLFFYFFGEIKNSLTKQFPNSVWHSYSILAPVMGILILFILYRLRKNKSAFEKTFLVLNLALLFFITADVFMIFITEKNKYSPYTSGAKDNYKPCDSCNKPDIYYLIYDSYTSSSQLQKDFDFANTSIETSLKNKGFTFEILPKNANFLIGSDNNNEKGEIVKIA